MVWARRHLALLALISPACCCGSWSSRRAKPWAYKGFVKHLRAHPQGKLVIDARHPGVPKVLEHGPLPVSKPCGTVGVGDAVKPIMVGRRGEILFQSVEPLSEKPILITYPLGAQVLQHSLELDPDSGRLARRKLPVEHEKTRAGAPDMLALSFRFRDRTELGQHIVGPVVLRADVRLAIEFEPVLM